MDTQFYYVLIGMSLLLMVSYLFSLIAKTYKIPSVLLLLFLGMGVRMLFPDLISSESGLQQGLQLVGTLGLVLIVLEGALELDFTREKLPLIRDAFLLALVVLLLTSALIAFVIHLVMPEMTTVNCLINAIPFSVISSAIAIPSVETVDEHRKEFVVYESIFSDIIGILVFNFFVSNPELSLGSFAFVGLDLVLVTLVAVGFSVLIFEFIKKDYLQVRYILLLSTVILLFVIGKLMHFSSLVIILIFGVILHNIHRMRWRFFKRYAQNTELINKINDFKVVTTEGAFMVRTFFFFVFGYSFSLSSLFSLKVIALGTLVLLSIYGVRFIYLVVFHRQSLSLEFFVAPRGLITILLFYNIPPEAGISIVSEGVLFYVILLSGLIMMLGVMKGSAMSKT